MSAWQEMSAQAKCRAVRKLLVDGMTIDAMVSSLGVSRHCVEGVMRRNGLRTVKGQGRPRKFNYAEMAEYYRDHSIQDTVEKFGCSTETVRTAARTFKVSRKRYSCRPEIAAAKGGLLLVARHFGYSLVECQDKLLDVLNKETTVAINLLEDAA